MPLTYICPKCGSNDIRRERYTLPNGTAHEFFCNSCELFESAFEDHDEIARLRGRWAGRDSKPAESTDSA